MSHRRIYRRILLVWLVLTLAAIPAVYVITLNGQIPNKVTVYVDQLEHINFSVPLQGELEENDFQVFSVRNAGGQEQIHLDFSEPMQLSVSDPGSYRMTLKLFGIFPYKTMEVEAIEPMQVIPGGESVGIYVETRGVMVLGSGNVVGKDGITYEPAENIIKSGDYIMALDGLEITGIDQVQEYMETISADEVVATILRNGEKQDLRLPTVLAEDGRRKLGIWLRDDTQGIGTLTYFMLDGSYGALGHGISDESTGLLIDVQRGKLLESDVINIIKGKAGEPGEMVGLIHNSEKGTLGTIKKNTETGIFGKLRMDQSLVIEEFMQTEAVTVGKRQEAQEGKAEILCEIDGKRERYEISIDKIKWNTKTVSKGMEIRITDSRLLEKTNGIVQGMSGSPILQNGKLIGAVTHVFVNDPTRGYGIFAEDMLQVGNALMTKAGE